MKSLFATLFGIIASSNAYAFSPTLVCENGKAFIKATTWDTGCAYPAQAFYKSLDLEASDISGGEIDVEIGYTFRVRNPHCANPRGMPFFHYLPLPVTVGDWEVSLDGELLGEVSFQTVLPCRVKIKSQNGLSSN